MTVGKKTVILVNIALGDREGEGRSPIQKKKFSLVEKSPRKRQGNVPVSSLEQRKGMELEH